MQNVCSLSDDLGIPLDELPQNIATQKEELENQIRAVKEMKTKRRKLLQSVDVTLGVLEDYDKNKDKLQNYESMEKQVNDLQQLISDSSSCLFCLFISTLIISVSSIYRSTLVPSFAEYLNLKKSQLVSWGQQVSYCLYLNK
jgi:hypothetical protein